MNVKLLVKLIREALHASPCNARDTVSSKYAAGACIHLQGTNGKKFRILIDEEN